MLAATENTNQPPVLNTIDDIIIFEGERLTFFPTAIDPNEDDVLVFSFKKKPRWISSRFTGGRLRGTPKSSDVGLYENIEVSVSDGEFSDSQVFSILVKNVETPGKVTGVFSPSQSDTNTRFPVSWNAISNADNYNVLVKSGARLVNVAAFKSKTLEYVYDEYVRLKSILSDGEALIEYSLDKADNRTKADYKEVQ